MANIDRGKKWTPAKGNTRPNVAAVATSEAPAVAMRMSIISSTLAYRQKRLYKDAL